MTADPGDFEGVTYDEDGTPDYKDEETAESIILDQVIKVYDAYASDDRFDACVKIRGVWHNVAVKVEFTPMTPAEIAEMHLRYTLSQLEDVKKQG